MEENHGDNGHRSRSVVTRRGFLQLSLGTLAAVSLIPACSSPSASPQSTAAAPAPQSTTAPTGAAPSKQPTTAAPAAVAPKVEVTVAHATHAGTLDPRRMRVRPEQNLAFQIHDSLLDMDSQAKVRPQLAESYELVDPNTWRFKLRQGVKFHNGEDFTAETVKFTIEQYVALDPPYHYVPQWGQGWPPSVEIESPTSVLIKTPKPNLITPRLLTRFGMLPSTATDAKYGDMPVGCGPFKLVEWVKGERVVMEAFPDYWKGAPKISRLIYRGIPDDAARAAALEAGEVQVVFDLPIDRAIALSGSQKVKVVEQRSMNIGTVVFNFNEGLDPNSPLRNLKVRQALRYAVDEKGILEGIYVGKAKRMLGPAPELADASADLGGYPERDVEKAKQLLSEAGFSGGAQFTQIFSVGEFAKDLDVSEAIQGQLSEVGVDLKLEQLDSGLVMERRPTADWDVLTNGITAWTADADFVFGTTAIAQSYKYPPDMQKAVDQANSAKTVEERATYLKEAQRVFWDTVPWLWSVECPWIHGMDPRIQGYESTPSGWLYLDGAEMTA